MTEIILPILRLFIDCAMWYLLFDMMRKIKKLHIDEHNDFLAICDLRERVRELERTKQ